MRHAAVGGTERVLDEVSRRLAERGHDVTILCRSHVQASHPSVRFVVLRSPVIGSGWRMWAFAGAVARHVARERYDLVYSLGRTWSHDVIRCSGGSHAAWLEQSRSSRGGKRGFGGWLRSFKDELTLAIERRSYAPGAYHKVIVNSRLVGDDLVRRYGIPADKLEVIYNGVDLTKFAPLEPQRRAELRAEFGVAEGELALLFLGTGYERKGLARLLEAFASLASRLPHVRVWVVGRDSDQARYERLAESLGISVRVRFFGERRDARSFFAAADLYVLPTWYDSFGFTVLEALACGTAVVTTDHAGAAELVEPGVHGAVLPVAASRDELARELLVWSDPVRLAKVRPLARARAELYGFDATMERMLDVLEQAARERAAGVG